MSEGTKASKTQEIQELIRVAVRAELQELKAECEYTSARIDEVIRLLQVSLQPEYDDNTNDQGVQPSQGLIESEAMYEMEEDSDDEGPSWVPLLQRSAREVIRRTPEASDPGAIILDVVRPRRRGVKA